MGEVGKRADLDLFQAALAEVQVFEDEVIGHVRPRHRRPREQVAVEVELERVWWNVARDGGQSST